MNVSEWQGVYVDVASVHKAREDWLRRVEDANKNKNLFAFFAGAGAGYAEFMSSPVYFNSGVSLILWRERTLWASRENANNRLLHRQLERMWTSSGGGLIGKQQQTVKLSVSVLLGIESFTVEVTRALHHAAVRRVKPAL